jgi:hypothetical protein
VFDDGGESVKKMEFKKKNAVPAQTGVAKVLLSLSVTEFMPCPALFQKPINKRVSNIIIVNRGC